MSDTMDGTFAVHPARHGWAHAFAAALRAHAARGTRAPLDEATRARLGRLGVALVARAVRRTGKRYPSGALDPALALFEALVDTGVIDAGTSCDVSLGSRSIARPLTTPAAFAADTLLFLLDAPGPDRDRLGLALLKLPGLTPNEIVDVAHHHGARQALARAVADHPALDERAYAYLLQVGATDDFIDNLPAHRAGEVRRALAQSRRANAVPLVRAMTEQWARSRPFDHELRAAVVRSAPLEKFRLAVRRLARAHPGAAAMALRAADADQLTTLHPVDLRPLLRSDDAEVRQMAVRLLDRVTPAAPRLRRGTLASPSAQGSHSTPCATAPTAPTADAAVAPATSADRLADDARADDPAGDAAQHRRRSPARRHG